MSEEVAPMVGMGPGNDAACSRTPSEAGYTVPYRHG